MSNYLQLGFDPRQRYLMGLGDQRGISPAAWLRRHGQTKFGVPVPGGGLGAVPRRRTRRLRGLGAFNPNARYLFGLGDDASDTAILDPYSTPAPIVMPYDMVGPLAPGEVLGPAPTGSVASGVYVPQYGGNIYGGLPNAGPGYSSSLPVPGSSPTGYPSVPGSLAPGGGSYSLAPAGTLPTAPGALTVGGQTYLPTSGASWFSQSSLIGGMSNLAVLAIGGIAALLFSSGGGRKR